MTEPRLTHAELECGASWPCVPAQLVAELRELRGKGSAWDEIQKRADDAHAYCQAHGLPLGEIVWHAILDDANGLRAENAKLRAALEAQDNGRFTANEQRSIRKVALATPSDPAHEQVIGGQE